MTCKSLVSLLDRGWIRLAPSGTMVLPARPSPTQELSGPRRAVRPILASAGLLGILFLMVLGLRIVPGAFWSGLQSRDSLFRLLNQQRRERVIEALEVHRREQGQYPEQLADLVKERLLQPDDLNLVGPSEFSYFLENPRSFRLHVTPAETAKKDLG